MTKQHAAIIILACQLARARRVNNQRAIKEIETYLTACADAVPADEIERLEAVFEERKEAGRG